jgi:Protein of unknown function (DUF2891)
VKLSNAKPVFIPVQVRARLAHRMVLAFWLLLPLALAGPVRPLSAAEASANTSTLTPVTASAWARLPLRCIEQEFPNKLDHVMNNAGEVKNPRALHPAFYGCMDWHSAVHGHWMLVRLLRSFPELPEAPQIRSVLNRSLTPENIRAEVDYLDKPNRKSFERTYGWAWLLKLGEELRGWNDPDAQRWAANLEPLARAIVKRYQDFLPQQAYPIRTGVHPNTAFGLAFALDYARAASLKEFELMLIERARFYFEKDQDYPAAWEPGGEDFFSPALTEADLMRRALAPEEFRKWFKRFQPGLGKQVSLLKPAQVTDRSDPKLVHLDGLNLSRAWCMQGIAGALPKQSSDRKLLLESAKAHLRAALPEVASGHYEGEHWLATFAVYALSETRL